MMVPTPFSLHELARRITWNPDRAALTTLRVLSRSAWDNLVSGWLRRQFQRAGVPTRALFKGSRAFGLTVTRLDQIREANAKLAEYLLNQPDRAVKLRGIQPKKPKEIRT